MEIGSITLSLKLKNVIGNVIVSTSEASQNIKVAVHTWINHS